MQEESVCVYRWDAYMHCFICHEPLFTGPARPLFLFAPCFCVGDAGAEGEVILLQLLKNSITTEVAWIASHASVKPRSGGCFELVELRQPVFKAKGLNIFAKYVEWEINLIAFKRGRHVEWGAGGGVWTMTKLREAR